MAKHKGKQRCFVVMGFGKKTDYATGRQLDLDRSYQLLIKPVVTEKGITCIRADEINHAGVIDLVMYQELLTADVVIADLSTANLNAIYELGVRHALRPYTTIVISEEKLTHPFNLNHISICSYKHLGDDIGFSEVERFRKVLSEKLDQVLKGQQPDSPVYTFLDGLVPPSVQKQTGKSLEQISDAVQQASEVKGAMEEKQTTQTGKIDKAGGKTITLSKLAQQGEEALKYRKFGKAKEMFEKAVNLDNAQEKKQCNQDPYLIHRLALATYKAKKPTVMDALHKSLELLALLDLDHTNDPKTVMLAGAIEKKLYEKNKKVEHLSSSILYYERSYYLLNNRYNGINLAYLYNCRADSTLDETEQEKIADVIAAKRVRKRVLDICDRDWIELKKREEKDLLKGTKGIDEELLIKQANTNKEQRFWILANKAEACLGLGLLEEYEKNKEVAYALKPADWMIESFSTQVEALQKLLKKQAYLVGDTGNK
jgi:hypothetical protein